MKAREKRVAVYESHAESDRADQAFYRSLSPQERLDLLLTLIARHAESIGVDLERLVRVHRIVELQQG
jgi:hypothetical protein